MPLGKRHLLLETPMHAMLLALALAAPPATLDEKIAAALKSHPDIKAAEAKKLLAEAELEQARLAITQRVSAAASRVELAKVKLMQAEEDVVIAEIVIKQGVAVSGIEKAQYMKARPALIGAKAELAAAELELQQLVGKGGVEAKPAASQDVPEAKLPTGPAIEKLEGAVRMTVKLGLKDMEPKKAMEELFTAVRLDPATVRGLKLLDTFVQHPPKIDMVGEQSFAGWVQWLLDDHNSQKGKTLGVYVREYGLLIEQVENAPKDAMTLTQFARAVRAKQK